MLITTCVRTFRDLEEPHIERFIESHLPFSDTILMGVFETSDKTLEIARRYPQVQFREFNERVTLNDGTWCANEARYYHFMNEWVKETDATIVIFDDADHAPNSALQRDARAIFESHPDTPFFYSLLLYLWGTQLYFPKLNECHPSERLWGWNQTLWQPEMGTGNPTTVEILNQPDARMLAGEGFVFPHPPYCINHFSYLNEESVQRKMAFNRKRGVAQTHPLESCGELFPLPDWAK